MSSRKRRTFINELKKEVVEDNGYSLKEASESLGVSQNSLRNWHKKFGKGATVTVLMEP